MLCAVLISVILCGSVADGWSGSNWRFWSNRILIVSNIPITTGTIFVLTFHNQLTSICTCQFFIFFCVKVCIICYCYTDQQTSLLFFITQYCNRDHWGDQDVDGRIILRWIFRKWEGVVGTGWSWLRIGTGGRRLWVRWWTVGFHKMRGISWLAAKPVSFSRRTLLHGVSK